MNASQRGEICALYSANVATITLKEFIALFASETALWDALVYLFSQMPGISDVRLVHGQAERGKDLLFYYRGALTESMLCVCVVKNEKITGSASSSQGAMTVVNQARQALMTKYTNPKGGDEYAERVYIISPHDCSQATIASVKGELEQRFGQLVFFCGHDLLHLFEQYAADFLLLRSGLLASYIASLRRQFDEDKAFANIAFRHGVLPNARKALSKAYVQPKFILRFSRFNLAENLPPQMITFRLAVTVADVKRAQKALIDTSDLIERAAEHHLTPGFESPSLRRSRASRKYVSSELDSRWQEAFRAYKVEEEKQGNRVLSSNASLELADADSFVAASENVSADADKVLQVLRYRLGRIKKFSRSHPPDPIEALKRDEVLDMTAARTLATQNPILLSEETRGVLRFTAAQLATHQGAVLIRGGAGFGKTSFCQWQTLADGEWFVRGESNILPVYVQLHRLGQGPLGSFEDVFLPDVDLIAGALKLSRRVPPPPSLFGRTRWCRQSSGKRN